MAPVSRMPPSSSSARRRETVDFPDPAGPAMAMVTPPAERACCVLGCIWPGYGPSPLGDGPAPLIQGTGEQLLTRGIEDRKSTRLNSSHVAISYAVSSL